MKKIISLIISGFDSALSISDHFEKQLIEVTSRRSIANAEASDVYVKTAKWISLIILGWVANFLVRFTVLFVNILINWDDPLSKAAEYTFGQLSMFDLMNAFGVTVTLVIVLYGSIDVFRNMSTKLLERLTSIAERDYESGIVEVHDGIRGISLMLEEFKSAKKVLNTHYLHHQVDKNKEGYHDRYHMSFEEFRTELTRRVVAKTISVEEIGSFEYKDDIKEFDYKHDCYEGYCIEDINVSWMNFTIMYFDHPNIKTKSLWFGSGVWTSGDQIEPHDCYYTRNSQIIKDFERRFQDLKKKSNKEKGIK